MTTQQHISQQIIRLGILPNAPDSTDAVEFAYRECAKNRQHAARITAWLLRHLRFFPVPNDVYQAGAETLEESDFAQPDRECPSCGGTGYGQAWQLVTHGETSGGGAHKSIDVITDPAIAAALRLKVDRKNQFLYDCAPRCTRCSYGRALAIAEQSRECAA